VEIAAGCSDGEGQSGRQKVVEWLLLDRVHVHGARIAVNHRIELAASVLAYTALATMTFRDNTSSGTELALDVIAGVGDVAVENPRWLG